MKYLLVYPTILALLLVAIPAQAEDNLRDDALVLARICVSESGFPRWDATADEGVGAWQFSDDCRSIAEVIRWGAERRGLSFSVYARAYARGVFNEQSTRSRAYVGDLEPDGSTPRRWPGGNHPHWSRYRQSWLAMYQHAQWLVTEGLPTSCSETPTDWGGRVDRARAEALQMHEISCGQTHNFFYVRHSVWRVRRANEVAQ